MAYTVLARKYRPQTFADLVGQEHVTRTLSNAITAQRVAHAFLFTGVRGVGKTTTARLLAKALNCETGPTPEPCGTCDICVSITAGRDTDVLEMDGASNNSVEDVRRLQESIPYRPQRDRFKVVIVDEVHMLSTGAFNAFLKTLEEPPEHVKFIFATTEAHKVPVTIRSRCQRYDFRLIPQAVVDARVREILRAENIEADDAAVAIVAREAAGSMRDALTLLDQIIAFGGSSLRGEEVAEVLGIAGRDAVHQVAEAVLRGDGAAVLRLVDQLAASGLDMLHFARQLLDLVRDMVVLSVSGKDTSLVSLSDAERARALEAATQVDQQELQRVFSGVAKSVEDVAQSSTPKITLEMGLVRLATRPPLLPLAELVARLDELERKAGGSGGGRGGGPRTGGARAGGSRPNHPSSAGAQPADEAPSTASISRQSDDAGVRPATASPPSATASSHAPSSDAMGSLSGSHAPGAHAPSSEASGSHVPGARAPSPNGSSTTPTTHDAAEDAVQAGADAGGRPPDDGHPAPRAPAPPATNGERSALSTPPQRPPNGSPANPATSSALSESSASSAPESGPRPDAVAPTASSSAARSDGTTPHAPTTAAARANGHARPDLDAWERIVSKVMDKKPAFGAVLRHGAPQVVSPERIVLSFPKDSFFGRQAEATDSRRGLAEAASAILGQRPEVEIEYHQADTDQTKTLLERDTERHEARIEETKREALNHPLVVLAQSLFAWSAESMTVHVETDS